MDFDIGNLFISELFITSEDRTLHFSDSDVFVDGRNKENRASKLKINGILSRSVIYIFVSQNSRKCILRRFADSIIIIGNN